MAGRPAAFGAVQLTDRLSEVPDTGLTEGSAGASGGSSSSATLTVTAWVASTLVSAAPSMSLPSCTDTVSEYDVVSSKFSAFAPVTVIAPLALMSNTASDAASSE